MITLTTTVRDAKVSAKNIRIEGQIPAVVYGPKQPNMSVSIPYQDFVRAYNKGGQTTLMVLDTGSAKIQTLVHDMTLDPVSNKVSHIDFYAVEAGKKVQAGVPLNFINESDAVKAGALLVKVLLEVEVECLPDAIPHSIDVDLEMLKVVDDTISVADLKLPAGVTMKSDAEEVVAAANAPEEEKEEVAIDLTKIEVEKKGKVEEEVAAE
jgi:large subunit ribosomal protein L25